MTLLTDEARAWGERIVSKMGIASMPEKYRQKAEMDLQLFKAALVADELLAAAKALVARWPKDQRPDGPLYDEAQALVAAIAKAEGRE